MSVDFFFHYKNIGRFIILNKFSSCFFNSYNILKFLRVVVCFSIKDTENVDDLSISNYCFFNFFFFGVQSFFFDFTSMFRLGVMYYDLVIQSIFVGNTIFFVLNFLLNEGLVMVLLNVNYNCWKFRVFDLSVFIDKRSVVGLFYIDRPLDFSFFFSSSWQNENVLFNLFKVKI